MDPNGSIPPFPPPPSGETFIAPQSESPKKKAHPFLIVFLILFILFDIAVGTMILLTKNKNQTTPLSKTQESNTSTATEDQNTSDTNVKQEGVTSLTAPKFQNKLIYSCPKKNAADEYDEYVCIVNPEFTDIEEINISQYLKQKLDRDWGGLAIKNDFYISPASKYILIDSIFRKESGGGGTWGTAKYTLFSTYDKNFKEVYIPVEKVPIINTKMVLWKYIGWSNDDQKILFLDPKILDLITSGPFQANRKIHLISYDISTQKTEVLFALPVSVFNVKYYSVEDQIIIFPTSSRGYYLDLKTNALKAINFQYKNVRPSGLVPNFGGTYYVDRAPGDDELMLGIYSVTEPTKPIRKIRLNTDPKDAIILYVRWSNDVRYLAVVVIYFNREALEYIRKPTIHFFTLDGEEILRDDFEAYKLPPSFISIGNVIFSADNKHALLSGNIFSGKNTADTFIRMYDLEKKQMISEFPDKANEKPSFNYAYPLAWY